MKSPTKRIFYHFGVTQSTFGTSTIATTPILARQQRVHARTCQRPAHTLAPAPTTCTQKSLVAERYQAFSEAKSLS